MASGVRLGHHAELYQRPVTPDRRTEGDGVAVQKRPLGSPPLHRGLRGFPPPRGGGLREGDFGGWGIVLKDDGAFIGTCGVDVGYAPEHARAELGYVLSREHWGKGLMPEAARAVIRFGFERMSLNRVEARCIAENTASAWVRSYKNA